LRGGLAGRGGWLAGRRTGSRRRCAKAWLRGVSRGRWRAHDREWACRRWSGRAWSGRAQTWRAWSGCAQSWRAWTGTGWSGRARHRARAYACARTECGLEHRCGSVMGRWTGSAWGGRSRHAGGRRREYRTGMARTEFAEHGTTGHTPRLRGLAKCRLRPRCRPGRGRGSADDDYDAAREWARLAVRRGIEPGSASSADSGVWSSVAVISRCFT
jgi:hypothetical protein